MKFIATCLAQRGIEVSVIGFYKSHAKEEVCLEEGVSVYRLHSSRWKSLRFLDHALRINKALRALHRKHKVDIVESTELGLAFIRKDRGIKYIIRMHGGHHFFAQAENRKINPWRGFQEKRSFAKADALVGVSQYVVNHTSTYLHFDPAKTPVIFNPVNPDKFNRADPSKMVEGRIVFVGTVCEKKGIRQLVMAMPEICRQIPKAHLMIAGRDWFFPSGLSFSQYLQDFIDPKVKDKIIFLGTLPNTEVPGLIESAEVCAYPSHMEAMPLAWLEGLAMGKAVVASKAGPGPEVIKDGVTGLLCDPYSPEDIAEKITYVLKNKSERDRFSEAGMSDVLHRFSSEEMILKNISFYKTTLKDN